MLVVLGPTASGKTRLAVQLAEHFGGEIVSADSRQVYRGLDIGAGKDLAEYGEIPCHLINVAELDEEYSVFHYQRDCMRCVQDIRARGKLAIICGGTGMYLDAVLSGYRLVETPANESLRGELSSLEQEELEQRLRSLKPDIHNVTDTVDRDRLVRAIEIAEYERTHPPEPLPELTRLLIGVQWPRPKLRQRIRARLDERMAAGLVEEVDGLLQQGVSAERLRQLGLEYRFVTDFIEGGIKNRNDLIQKLASAINQFAKRQETWFRRMERQGHEIHWIPEGRFDIALEVIETHVVFHA